MYNDQSIKVHVHVYLCKNPARVIPLLSINEDVALFSLTFANQLMTYIAINNTSYIIVQSIDKILELSSLYGFVFLFRNVNSFVIPPL